MLISAFAWRLIITMMHFRQFKILIATVYCVFTASYQIYLMGGDNKTAEALQVETL